MEELKSLANLISKNKLKQISLIGEEKTTNLGMLYEGIISGKFKTDLEAKNYFYGNSENRNLYFSRLKRQLKEKLLNTLFLIDVNQPSYTQIQRAYYTCFKNLSAAKILLGRYQKKTAISLLEKTLKQALKFEFTDIIIETAKELRLHFGSIQGDRKKFEEYNKIVNFHIEVLSAELKAEEYYSSIACHFAKSRATKIELLETIKNYSNELEPVTRKFQSFRLNLHAFLIFTMRHEIENDYENTLQVCKDAIKFFQKKKNLASNTTIFTFLFKMLASYIHLRNYDKAEKVANQCLDLLPHGSGNWFLTLEYYLMVCFHSNQYQKGYEIFIKATEQNNYGSLTQSMTEHWRVYEAFIFYFISIKKINIKGNHDLKKFRVSKFLNEVPTISKDKRGTNINILILQILFLLQQGKYGDIIDKMEPLKTYNHRYLRKDDTFRSNCFIKMLLQLPQNSFHKAAVLRKADKYWKKLQSVPLDIANQSSEIEIVPYETLWQYVVESLEFRFH